MERTLVILKPSSVQRAIVGDIISRFEKKGLRLAGMKMMVLTDEILEQHYAHLKGKPFFKSVIDSMKSGPVIIQCWAGVDAVKVVRALTGVTNGRQAQAGTIRGDFAMSSQENVVHSSDSTESAGIEIKRFFDDNEIFNYKQPLLSYLYSSDEI